jgi:hypothetical protein
VSFCSGGFSCTVSILGKKFKPLLTSSWEAQFQVCKLSL